MSAVFKKIVFFHDIDHVKKKYLIIDFLQAGMIILYHIHRTHIIRHTTTHGQMCKLTELHIFSV